MNHVQCILEVIAIYDELLGALLGREDIHHLAKASHMNNQCSRVIAVHVGHLGHHQLLLLQCTWRESEQVWLVNITRTVNHNALL